VVLSLSLFAEPAVLDIPAKYRLIDDLRLSCSARLRKLKTEFRRALGPAPRGR
jgi:hypothetical protein